MAFSLITYFKETRAELKHVAWPTRRHTLSSTALVIGLSIIVAYYLGFFDFTFNYLLRLLIL